MKRLQSSERRRVLLSGAKAISLAVMGSLVWGAFLSNQAKASLILRPPGAREESEFLKSCIRCGLCVEACPFDTLILAKTGERMAIGTPYFIPRDIPCEMCVDIPCVPICPTQALDTSLVSVIKDGIEVLDINLSRMGVAVVDQEHCLAYLGIRCEACYRACPLIDEAITIEYRHNEITGKHAQFLPIVHNDVCTGCGKCEQACVTTKATITVVPRHSVIGWDEKSELLQKGEGSGKENIDHGTKGATDYLNSEEF